MNQRALRKIRVAVMFAGVNVLGRNIIAVENKFATNVIELFVPGKCCGEWIENVRFLGGSPHCNVSFYRI